MGLYMNLTVFFSLARKYGRGQVFVFLYLPMGYSLWWRQDIRGVLSSYPPRCILFPRCSFLFFQLCPQFHQHQYRAFTRADQLEGRACKTMTKTEGSEGTLRPSLSQHSAPTFNAVQHRYASNDFSLSVKIACILTVRAHVDLSS